MSESVVFDAEPIVVWIDQRSGASAAEEYLTDTYHGTIETAISGVNLTEVYYSCVALEDRAFAQEQTQYLRDVGVEVIGADRTWERAAIYKHEYTPDFPLGDAFALAASTERGRPLLVGDDRHWDDPEADGASIVRLGD